jgi:SP family arabinose:H+ symporter-like MFS transporter
MSTELLVLPASGKQAGRGYAYFVAFVAAVGGFLFGYDLLIINGAQIFLRDYFHLSPGELGFATSSAILGCVAGPTLGAYLCDRLGRKSTLIIAALLFAAGAVGTGIPRSITAFNVFRIIGGVGVGLASLASPLYIAEIAPAPRRGRLGIMYQLAITVGATAAVVVAWWIARSVPDIAVNWRWMFASMLVPVVAFVALLLAVPQSPRWLVGQNRPAEALAILTKINGPAAAQKDLAEIQASLQVESGSLAELFQPGIRTALLTGILLGLFNNWTGWSGVAYYLPTLFQMGGYADASDAIGVTVVPIAAHFFLTFVAIWLVDRVGRRPLWLWTSAAMIGCLVLMGLVFHYQVQGPVVILMLLLIAVPHAVGFGPLPWLMMSEIYPTRIRARAVSISTTFLWIAGFTGTLAFPTLAKVSEQRIGSVAGIFWMYAVICVGALMFGWKLLPETKNRSLEEIGQSWGRQG